MTVLFNSEPSSVTGVSGGTSVTIANVQEFSVAGNGSTFELFTDGNPYALDGGLVNVSYTASMTTYDVSSINDLQPGTCWSSVIAVFGATGDCATTSTATLTATIQQARISSMTEGADNRRKNLQISWSLYSSDGTTAPVSWAI